MENFDTLNARYTTRFRLNPEPDEIEEMLSFLILNDKNYRRHLAFCVLAMAEEVDYRHELAAKCNNVTKRYLLGKARKRELVLAMRELEKQEWEQMVLRLSNFDEGWKERLWEARCLAKGAGDYALRMYSKHAVGLFEKNRARLLLFRYGKEKALNIMQKYFIKE